MSVTVKVISVTVGLGSTFNNPYERFHNLRPSVSIDAVVDPDATTEELVRVTHELQRDVSALLWNERRQLLQDCKDINLFQIKREQVHELKRRKKRLQDSICQAFKHAVPASLDDLPRQSDDVAGETLNANVEGWRKDVDQITTTVETELVNLEVIADRLTVSQAWSNPVLFPEESDDEHNGYD